MLSFLSPTQRLVLVLGLIAASQASVIAGLSIGWSAGLVIGASLVFAAAAAFVFVDGVMTLRGTLDTVVAASTRMAQGDLSVDIPRQGSGDSGRILRSLAELQASLRQSIGAIRTGSGNVAHAVHEIAVGNADLSNRTEQTAGNLQQVASAMQQLSTTVNQTAESARTANQLASSATEVAKKGGEVVAQVVTTMDAIHGSSRKIADIIGVIDGIAFQTNILALNAAVEAARAGEQGRGFAVVAGEVRNLAQRSADAAKEIKALIGSSVDKVESGAKLVADAGTTMTDIVASVQRVSDIIGEISAAAAEQSSGLAQVSGNVGQLDQATQQNAALVEESAAAAESLKDQAQRLGEVVAGFRTGAGDSAPRSTPAAPAKAPSVAAAAKAPSVAAPAAVAKAAIGSAKAAAKADSKPVAKADSKPAAKAAKPEAKAEPKPAAAPKADAEPKPAAAVSSAPAAKTNDDDWETF
jgi:methyl-accepting chemotaxis protein